MKQIFKNYLATFIKNWLQTIGTILFILLMAATVIGFLAAPLQIYTHITAMNLKNNRFSQEVTEGKFHFNNRFLYQTVYENNEYDGLRYDSSTNEYVTDDSLKIVSKRDEPYLSELYFNALKKTVNYKYSQKHDENSKPVFSSINDKYDAYGDIINGDIDKFEGGALSSTYTSFKLNWKDDTDNIGSIFNDYENNINNIITMDAMYAGGIIDPSDLQGKSTTEIINMLSPSVQSRIAGKINAIFSVNSFSYTFTDLGDYFDPITWKTVSTKGNTFGKTIVDLMKAELWKRNFRELGGNAADIPTVNNIPNWTTADEDIKSKVNNGAGVSERIKLISSQIFNSDDKTNPNNFYGSLLGYSDWKLKSGEDWAHSEHYAHQPLLQIIRNISGDRDNYLNKTNPDHQLFEPHFESFMYLNQKSSSSLFPTLGIDLYTINGENDPNQLQLREGRRPEKLVWHSLAEKNDILDQLAQGIIIPEIVINSGFADNNNLHVGDYITLPDQPENNNVSSILASGSSDDVLTSQIKCRISGIGEKFADATPGGNYTPYMENIKNYANGYIDDGLFSLIDEAKWSNSAASENILNTFIRFTNNSNNSKDPIYMFAPHEDQSMYNDAVFKNSNNPFVNYKDTGTMTKLNNIKIRVIIFIILGVAVLALAFVFINFIITKELNETRRQIGIFKSFGYGITELSWIFAIKTFLTILFGVIFGFLLSFPLQLYSASNYSSTVMFKFDKIYANGGFLSILFIVIPIIFLAVSYFMTLFYLREPTLSLLSNGTKVKKGKVHTGPLIKYLSLNNKGFGYRLQQGFVKNSKGKFVVVQILFAFASLVFTLMFGAQTLMYSVANQGFASLTKSADHKFAWENQDQINIPYGQSKYQLSDQETFKKRNLKYIPYTGNEKIGDVLNEHSDDLSDSRYRENYLISSISNTFDISKGEAFEMLMPLDYYLVKSAGISPDDLTSTVDKILDNKLLGNIDSKLENLLREAAKQDSKLSALPDSVRGQEMLYHDYYLNWILSFRISSMSLDDANGNPGMEKIKADLIAGNNKNEFNLDKLIEYVKNDNDIKIDMSKIVSGNADETKKKFNDTLFGLSDVSQSDGEKDKKNNLFLSDITKIITLELAETYATSVFNNSLPSVTNNDKSYSYSEIAMALQSTRENQVLQEFTPNDKKFWGMQNNPLMGSNDGSDTPTSKTSFAAGSASQNGGGLSLSKMSGQTISLVMAAAMLGYNSPDIQDMPVATINEAFFNKDKESLFYEIPVTGVDDTQWYGNVVRLFKYDKSFGTYETSQNHDGISDGTMKELANDSSVKDTINATVPYGLAKYRDWSVGDVVSVFTDTKSKQEIKLHIIGIDKSVAMSLGQGWSINVDYDQFLKHYFDEKQQELIEKQPLFNMWMSNEPMLQGDINLDDISGSVNSMRYVGKNLAISIAPGSSVFGSIFDGLVDFSTLLGSNIDKGYRLITNPNVASSGGYSSVSPYNILRAGVDDGIDKINNILILFMCLVAILLTIILVIVMNIIVEQATPIILTLKSLGYKQLEINWITMGSYITGALISFLIAYGLSLLVWNVFLIIAGSLWHIYVFMAYSWEAPVVTFLVIGFILFIGWFVSDRKVEKIPLTLVTGFN